MEYRTKEQFNELIETAINGNWSDAAAYVVEYGFYANDLIQAYKNSYFVDSDYFEATDLCIIVEAAAELRNKD